MYETSLLIIMKSEHK